MKKREYIEMLMQDIATETDKNKRLYSDVIDCVDIALSGEPDDFEIDGKINYNASDLSKSLKCSLKSSERVISGYPRRFARIIRK